MAEISLVLGGARSGKSAYALHLAGKAEKKAVFIATCQALDKEIAERIELHKKTRPKSWHTFEEPYKVSLLLNKIGNKFEVILIDCLTLLVSNLMLKGLKADVIAKEVNRIFDALGKTKAKAVIVSNEVGLGIVPDNKIGRVFRDVAGRINQLAAGKSDKVYFMISGIPWKIK